MNETVRAKLRQNYTERHMICKCELCVNCVYETVTASGLQMPKCAKGDFYVMPEAVCDLFERDYEKETA